MSTRRRRIIVVLLFIGALRAKATLDERSIGGMKHPYR